MSCEAIPAGADIRSAPARWRDPETGARAIWRGGVLWAADGAGGRYQQMPGVGSYEQADELARSLGLIRWGGRHGARAERRIAERALRDQSSLDGGPVLSIVRLVIPSADAPGHEDRMRRNHLRYIFGLPITSDGPHDPDHACDMPECWGCGERAPVRTWVEKHGWQSRETLVYSGAAHKRREIYCPECFAEWGWPDGGSP